MKIPFTALPILFSALALLFLNTDATHAQDAFTRITSDPAVSGVNSTILAWADFNNDGFQDLFVSTRTGPGLLYSNNGNGTFSRVLDGPVATDSGNCFGATWGDYDNDGFLDLFVGVNNSGNDWLYRNNGNGGFTKVTTGAIVSSGGNANNCSWADYDNDGFLDLFVANSDQNDFLYHNNGDGTFTRVTTNAIALKTGNSQGGAWADYDNDGRPDLFVSRVNEPNLLYHNEGQGVFRAVTNGIIVHDVSVGQGTSWGDYDNDGFLDLFVVNPNARNFLYHNNGDGSFTKIANGAIVTDIGNGHGCSWADYDNDGFLDLFVANRLGPNFLYHNNGHGGFDRVGTGIVSTDVADSISGAWADYDNDGFMDLFVTQLNSFNNRLYHNTGNENAWLTLQLVGRLSNRAGIGAKVRVRATMGGQSIWQFREISGGGGLGSQNDLRASFGLRDATQIDLVRIEWPSGMVQELHDLAPRQFLTVLEAQVTGPVVIMKPPRDLNVRPGSNVVFSVTAAGINPISYQWRFSGTDLPDATNATLFVPNAQLNVAGPYEVTVCNSYGCVTSGPVSLQILINPMITLQPLSQAVALGGNATLNVTVTGSPAPFTFEWRRGSTVLWTNVTTEPMSFFALTNAQTNQGGTYRAVIKNAANSAGIASSNALISIVADTDGDGLPDTWETAHDLNPTDPTDARMDHDGDGANNLDEYRSGTDPRDPQSLLRVERLVRSGTGAWALRFWAASNRTYSVESREQPSTGSWQKTADIPAASTNRLVEIMLKVDDELGLKLFRLVSPRQP